MARWRKGFLGAGLLWVAAGAQAAACPALPGGMALQAVAGAPSVWRVPAAAGESQPANAGAVTQLLLVPDGRRLWLVGSGPTPRWGRALACAIQARWGRPVSDVINTRAHPELALANEAFEGSRIWALDSVAQAMRRQCADCLARLALRLGPRDAASLARAHIRTPDHTLGPASGSASASASAVMGAGRLGPFEWQAVARAPGQDTLALYLPRQRLWVLQGLLWQGGVPNLRDTDSATLLRSWQALLAQVGEGDRLLGEQGGLGRASDLAAHIRYVQALRAEVRQAVLAGRGELESESESESALPLAQPQPVGAAGGGGGGGAADAAQHALNRQRVWRELEAEAFVAEPGAPR